MLRTLLSVVGLACLLVAAPARAQTVSGSDALGFAIGGAVHLAGYTPGGFRMQLRYTSGPINDAAFDAQLNLTVGGGGYGTYCVRTGPGRNDFRCYYDDYPGPYPYGRGNRGTAFELLGGVRKGFRGRGRLVPYAGVAGGLVLVNYRYDYGGDGVGIGIRPHGGVQILIGSGFSATAGLGVTAGPMWYDCGPECSEVDAYAQLDILVGLEFRF